LCFSGAYAQASRMVEIQEGGSRPTDSRQSFYPVAVELKVVPPALLAGMKQRLRVAS